MSLSGPRTAFLSPASFQIKQHAQSTDVCGRRLRMASTPPPENEQSTTPTPPPIRKMPVTNNAASTEKIVRNKPGMEGSSSVVGKKNVYADASAGDMVGAPEVGEGMGPRRGVGEKKVTRAAAIQKSQTFADAWAEQNEGKVDVWVIIGIVTLLTPLVIIAWAVATGVIPTGGLFEQ